MHAYTISMLDLQEGLYTKGRQTCLEPFLGKARKTI